jgi:hypothetical protein
MLPIHVETQNEGKMRSLEKFSMSNNEIHLMEISKRTPEIVT